MTFILPLLVHSDVRVVILALVFLVLTTALHGWNRRSRRTDGTGRHRKPDGVERETERRPAK